MKIIAFTKTIKRYSCFKCKNSIHNVTHTSTNPDYKFSLVWSSMYLAVGNDFYYLGY